MPQVDNNLEEYATHCADCYCTDNLIMVAHRVKGKMIGWLFVCRDCWPTMSKVVVLERTEADGKCLDRGTYSLGTH